MNARRSNWLGAWFDLARSTTRASARLGKKVRRAAAAGVAKEVAKNAPAVRKTAKWLLSGVATPAPVPAACPGRWIDGQWGLGPLAMRRYRLYLPPAASARRPLPLLMLLHGCGQDAASFAAATRAAAGARSGGYAVLLPEQSSEANPQRCWNWFGPEAVVALETGILMAMVDHLCAAHPLRRDRVYALGLSAGGAMAMSLALRYPERLVAVGTHSGAMPHSASTPLQAGQAMRGRREPRLAALRQRLAGRPLPPLIVIHGEADQGVAPANALASAELWLDLAATPIKDNPARTVQHGARHPHHIRDWSYAGRPYVRLVYVSHLGHAWSGGTRRQAFSDPGGPDALKLAWRFFSACAD